MILFWIKEAFKLIGRAKSSFFLSLISTTISVLLIISSLILLKVSVQFQTRLKKNIKINVFLNESISNQDISKIKDEIKKEPFVNKTLYISKNEAARIFINQTGEDFRKLLSYNPLPASFSVTLNESYVKKDSINNVVSALSNLHGVDEVVFNHRFTYKLLSYLSNIKQYVFIITLLLLVISLYIVFSTVKLITNAKYKELETMKLVGAKLSTIKMPIILNTIFIGFIAGLIALGAFGEIIYQFRHYYFIRELFSAHDYIYLIGALLLGPILGFLVSTFSLRKITLKI